LFCETVVPYSGFGMKISNLTCIVSKSYQF
jgi:hypothetical protein